MKVSLEKIKELQAMLKEIEIGFYRQDAQQEIDEEDLFSMIYLVLDDEV